MPHGSAFYRLNQFGQSGSRQSEASQMLPTAQTGMTLGSIFGVRRIDAPCITSQAGHHTMVATQHSPCWVFFLVPTSYV